MKNKIKTVKHYEVVHTKETPIILDTFQDMQDIVSALHYQKIQCRAYTVFTNGAKEEIHNLI